MTDEIMPGDLIVKTARGRIEVWHPAVEFAGPGVVVHVTPGAIGHPHAGEGFVAPAGTHVTIETVSTAPPEAPSFFAICRFQHDPSLAGVDPTTGIWTALTRANCIDAVGDVQGHEDGGAIVVQAVGSSYIGPVGCG